jgi:hypothetical protein
VPIQGADPNSVGKVTGLFPKERLDLRAFHGSLLAGSLMVAEFCPAAICRPHLQWYTQHRSERGGHCLIYRRAVAPLKLS